MYCELSQKQHITEAYKLFLRIFLTKDASLIRNFGLSIKKHKNEKFIISCGFRHGRISK